MLQRFAATALFVLVTILFVGAMGLVGCSSDEKKPAPAPAAAEPMAPPVTLRQVKTDLLHSKAQLETTTNAMTALKQSSQENAQANYNTFATEYAKLQSSADNTRQHAKDLRQRSREYYEAWSNETSSNPDIQRSAIQQRAEANKTFTTISSEMDLAKMSFDQYMKDAKDVGTYLKTGVSPARIATVSDTITKAEGESADTTKHLDAIVAGVDQMLAASGK
jgi:membrane-bound lytic murein transglycosylase